jgi:hypothetical protein
MWFKLVFALAFCLQHFFATAQTAPSAPGSAGRFDDALELTSVRVISGHPDFGTSRQQLTVGRAASPISAIFIAKGSGTVSGHWELATPADGAPSSVDLTPTPLLAASARFSQRRFRQLGTFSFSLSPGERHIIHSPLIEASLLNLVGRYHVILRLDTVSTLGSGTPVMPSQIAPVVIELGNAEK